MFSNPTSHWNFFSYTLHFTCRPSLFLRSSYFTRCKLWMIIAHTSCKWSLMILYLFISSYRTWLILWILHNNRNMKYWCNSIHCNNSNSIYRLCSSMRTNKILRRYCHHQPIFRNPLYWPSISRMIMRGIRSR